jgi:hypothetical protein
MKPMQNFSVNLLLTRVDFPPGKEFIVLHGKTPSSKERQSSHQSLALPGTARKEVNERQIPQGKQH